MRARVSPGCIRPFCLLYHSNMTSLPDKKNTSWNIVEGPELFKVAQEFIVLHAPTPKAEVRDV